MPPYDKLLLMLVFLPFLCAPLSFLIGRRWKRGRDTFALGVSALELLLTLTLLAGGGGERVELPGFCGLGISFQSGDFHTVMALLAATGWTAATVFSREYFAHLRRRNRYYLFWLATLGGTMGVFLSADLFTTFIFFEVMSFTSYVAVVQTEDEAALRAGETYLAVAVIGGMITLSGLFLLFWQLGTLRFDQMGQAAALVRDRNLLWAGGLLTLVGFGAKAGAFPLHIWLPTAHPAAPAPASAVLSGVITKTGIYGVAVLSTTLFLHDGQWGLLLAVIGGITMVLGAALAVCSADLKRTLACSSISQIGFILVGLAMQCLLGHHNALAVDGTILHIVNHSLVKMALFPAAGIIYLSTHSFQLDDIRGFGRGKPLLALCMGLPMLSLAGLPLLSGYVSKTLLHESIVEYIHLGTPLAGWFTLLEWLFLFTGGLTLAYMLKLFLCIFVEQNRLPQRVLDQKWHTEHGYIARPSAAVLVCYAALMPALGLRPGTAMDPIAAFARAFFHGEAPAHAVDYFAWVNLKGAVISIAIGLAVYFGVVRTVLMPQDGQGRRYADPIPKRLNLEYGVYRPLLRLLCQLTIAAAAVLDQAGPRLLFRALPSGVRRLRHWCLQRWAAVVRRVTGREYIPRPGLEEAVDDQHFGLYADHPHAERGFVYSMAFGLLLTGLGLVFAIGFVFLRG